MTEQWPAKVSAIIFDLDGTLLDSEPLNFEASRLVLAQHGVEYTLSDHNRFSGWTSLEGYEALRSQYSFLPPAEELNRQEEAALVPLVEASAVPIDGVVEVLSRLAAAGYRLAVASSSSPAMIEVKLRVLGISQFFELTVSSVEVGRGKPAPDVFLETARRLGVPPANCVVIEDSRNGVLGARAAGMCCCAVPSTTMRQDFSEATFRLRCIRDVLARATLQGKDAREDP